jgi:hypothetical protein
MRIMDSILASIFGGIRTLAALVFPVTELLGRSGSFVLISLIAGLLLIIVYGKISAQGKIAKVKRTIAGALMESVLYRHSLALSLKAQGRALVAAATYAGLAIPPLIFLAIPTILLLGQLYPRYVLEPLKKGDTVTVTASFSSKVKELNDISLTGSTGLEISDGISVIKSNEKSWRLSIIDEIREAPQKLELSIPDSQNSKQSALELELISPLSEAPNGYMPFGSAWYLGGALIPEKMADKVTSLTLKYQEQLIPFLGIEWNWLLLFFLVSLVGGLGASKLFNIEI